MTQQKPRTTLQLQLQSITKYLQGIRKQDVFNLSMKIYPVIASPQPYMSFYLALKKQVGLVRGKGVSFQQIESQLTAKAYAVDSEIGKKVSQMLKQEKEFLPRFQCSSGGSSLVLPVINNQSQKNKQITPITVPVDNHNEVLPESKFPLKQLKSPIQQKFTPVSGPIRNDFFLDSPLLIADKQPQSGEDLNVYKIGNSRPQMKNFFNNNHNSSFRPVVENNNGNSNGISNEKKQVANKSGDKVKSTLQSKIDVIAQQRRKNDNIMNYIEDPLSSARPATVSPHKQNFNPYQPSPKSFVLPPQKTKTTFFQPHNQKHTTKTVDKYIIDLNSIRNLSQRSLCLCQTSCDNIVLSQDSFCCTNCENIYHTRCMKKTADAKHCLICQLRLMIPNRVVCQEMFVGVLRKGKKKHEVNFNLPQDMVNFMKSKKDFSFRLQVRCFRIKSQTQNQTLFPDNCTMTLNSKQLKEFKPLHKQSSLKYRRDQPISIFKHYQTGENKITITEFHPSGAGGIERVQPEDHLIGVYMIQEEGLNATVQRIIKSYVTTFQESKNLLNKAFYMNDESNQNNEAQEDAISCEVVKIPLTCALTTDKLNFPARGFLCKHFQCFDLKNYIMMTSSSSNPRWVCPICKSSCYQFRIDCIITAILNEYTGCNKVETLVLYKTGAYEVMDRDEESIDYKGAKLKQPQQKNISQLKIVDRLKRERQQQAQLEMIKLQEEAEKKKRKVLQLPPEDQIVSLLSDSD